MFGSGGSSSGLSRPDPVKQSRMGSEVVGFFFLPLCLLGCLIRAGLARGFTAIYRQLVLLMWQRQTRAKRTDSPSFTFGLDCLGEIDEIDQQQV